MALSKAQKAARAQKNIDDARAALAVAEAAGADAGLITAPSIGGGDKRNTSTVWIGCKLPKGLVLQLCQEVTLDKPTFGGGVKPTKMYMRTGEQVRLKGYAVPFGKVPNYPIIGDFGLTEVSRDFWEEWIAQNPKFEMLEKSDKNPNGKGLIFFHGEKSSVEAYATEHANTKCGLEPLDPAGDKRADPINSDNLSDIEADTERSKKTRAVG
jgi:hypothetical protein